MWRLIRVDQNTSLPNATNQGARKRSETNERAPRGPMISLQPRAGKISLSCLRPSDSRFCLLNFFFAKILFSTFSRLFIAFFDMPLLAEERAARTRALDRLLAPAFVLAHEMSDARRLHVASGLLLGILRLLDVVLLLLDVVLRLLVVGVRLHLGGALPGVRLHLGGAPPGVFLRLLVVGARLHLGGARIDARIGARIATVYREAPLH